MPRFPWLAGARSHDTWGPRFGRNAYVTLGVFWTASKPRVGQERQSLSRCSGTFGGGTPHGKSSNGRRCEERTAKNLVETQVREIAVPI